MLNNSPNLERLHVLDERGGRQYVYPADVHGRFTRLRPWLFLLLMAFYAALPWITIGGHPAVFLDIAARRFFLFGRTFNAQDFYLVFFLLTGIGFLLIVLAALFGRVWCGWACPQTVFLEGLYRRIERWVEGSAARRQALARGGFTLEKLARKALKHALYLLITFVLAHLFLAYFVSAEKLLRMIAEGPRGHSGTFLWGLGLTAALYWNFFWFREQLCLIVCPYGRLQSAMQDPDTIHIGYDQRRGEPRGKLQTVNAGDCVDCRRCVAVCPTGIDIRNGLQYECIGCAACIDACDEVMDKMNYPRGLIRYTTENALEKHYPESQIWTRIKRPRVIMYSLVLFTVAGIAITGLMMRQPMKVDILRDRASLVRETQDGLLENTYNIRFINISENPQKLKLSVQGLPGIKLVAERDVFDVPPTGNVLVTLNVQAPPESAPKGSHKIQFVIKSLDDNAVNLEEPSSFIGE